MKARLILLGVLLLPLPACQTTREIAKEVASDIWEREKPHLKKYAEEKGAEALEKARTEATMKAAEAKEDGNTAKYALWTAIAGALAAASRYVGPLKSSKVGGKNDGTVS